MGLSKTFDLLGGVSERALHVRARGAAYLPPARRRRRCRRCRRCRRRRRRPRGAHGVHHGQQPVGHGQLRVGQHRLRAQEVRPCGGARRRVRVAVVPIQGRTMQTYTHKSETLSNDKIAFIKGGHSIASKTTSANAATASP